MPCQIDIVLTMQSAGRYYEGGIAMPVLTLLYCICPEGLFVGSACQLKIGGGAAARRRGRYQGAEGGKR